jgi:hypothetical protein
MSPLEFPSSAYPLMERIAEHVSLAVTRDQANQKQSKTKDEICSGCGHPRSRHLYGSAGCVDTSRHGGAGFNRCNCPAFNAVRDSIDDRELKSECEDRRDLRDPLSEEMSTFTRRSLSEIRGLTVLNEIEDGLGL